MPKLCWRRLQADAAHPAFSNLFIETEFFAGENALLAHRRQRSQKIDPSGAFTWSLRKANRWRSAIRN